MCLEFGSCFGGGRTDDYGGERPNRNNEHGGGRHGRDRRGNHRSAYNGDAAGHKPALQVAYHYQPPVTVDEAGHKAYHDGTQKADHAGAGGRGGYPAYPQRKADLNAPKLPTWQNKVGEDAYMGRLQVQEPAAMDYHHYPTTNTTTALGWY